VVWTGYGSADTGDLGVETKSTIKLRKFIEKNESLKKELFDSQETPMILQLADHGYVEIVDRQIVVTKDQLIPLVRYNTGDCGGLLCKSQLSGKNISKELVDSLPEKMIYVYGRATDNIIFYGTNLNVVNINAHFNALPSEFNYGGLFQVRAENTGGIIYFQFTIYTCDNQSEQLKNHYYKELVDFLKSQSNEFAAKYTNLTESVGEPLISIKLQDITHLNGKVKHKFIID